MSFRVAVGSYNILKLKGKEVEAHFSKMVEELEADGWVLRGPLQSSTEMIKVRGVISIYVTLVQDFTKHD
jgi:hypothetical protein